MVARCWAVVLGLAVFAGSAAQAAPIQSFAVFAGGNLTTNTQDQATGAAGANGNVILGYQNTFPSVTGGGALNNSSGAVNISGPIVFNGNVAIGFGGNIPGNTHSGGTVSGSGNITAGNVYQANAAAINLGFGSTATSLNPGAIAPTLQSFTPVTIPAASAALPGGTNVSVAFAGSSSPAPGNYGSFVTNSNATVNLSAGDYDFDTLDLGFQNIVNINLAGGTIHLVVGTLNLNTQITWNVTGGGADDVYLEVQNAGTTNLPFAMNFPGTIFFSKGSVQTGSNTTINGALWAKGNIDLGFANQINYVASNALPSQFQPAAPTQVPEPASLCLWGLALAVGGAAWRKRKVAA